MNAGERKVLIDTDPGHDDAMAIMLACASRELAVLAITTVCGNSTIENTTRNARFILDFIGRNDISVHSGADKPLVRDLRMATVHGQSGLEGIDPTNESRLTGDAVEKILTTVRENPGKVTILGLGPLTNIAQAIETDPTTMDLVEEYVLMAGAIDVPGNMSRVAEFNTFVDPEAADIVMHSSVPKRMVPLDACNNVLMQVDDVARVADPRVRKLLEDMLDPYIENQEKDSGVRAALMYDPLTIFCLLQPDACTTKAWHVQVETKGAVTRGMTVVDKRKVHESVEPNVQVVHYIEPGLFIERFVSTLNEGFARNE